MSKIKLRDYQKKVIKDIDKLFETQKTVVMAMCPGAGKTVTALSMAKKRKGRVLVLAHGTNVIKTQWHDRIKEYEIDTVDIEIPQSIRSMNLSKIDLLIVDEAHEFYYADTVQNIIKKTKPNKILLLTGTPSKFIRNKVPLVLVSADGLIQEGYLSDVYFGNVSSKDSILKSDYNKDGDVKESVEHKSVEEDLDCMMKHVIKRLKSTITKDKPTLTKLTSWTPILGKLHKTLIACRNIPQAKKVAAYFKKNSTVDIALSDSLTDTESAEVNRFVEDPNVKVLIVVRRGILGFDLTELVNVIDLTGTRNIDRIYQLIARVMRKDPNHPMKYFFKIAPEGDVVVSEFYLRAAISMVDNAFMSKFNGKNLSNIELPYELRKRKKGLIAKGDKFRYNKKTTKMWTKGKIYEVKKIVDDEIYFKCDTGKEVASASFRKNFEKARAKGRGAITIDPELFETVESLVQLVQLYNKSDSLFNEVSYITLGGMRYRLGETVPIRHIGRENLKYMIDTGDDDNRIY